MVEVVEADASAVALPSPRGRGRVGSDDVGIKRVAAWAVEVLMVAAAATDSMHSHRHYQRCVHFGSSRRNPMRISNTI